MYATRSRKQRRQSLEDDDIDELLLWDLLFESSDDSDTISNCRAKRRVIDRGITEGHARIFQDYFSDNPVYPESMFRRRYRLPSKLLKSLIRDIEAHDSYFKQRRDAVGRLGASAYQKITAALRVLCYGVSFDSTDEYCRESETVCRESFHRFCRAVVELHAHKYLRNPTIDDLKRIEKENAKRGFPGMIGSLDCSHFRWKNCPRGWSGQFTGKEGKPTVVLEAIASGDLWIWHAVFGLPGSLNDINILQKSTFVDKLIAGIIPDIPYSLNGNLYTQPWGDV